MATKAQKAERERMEMLGRFGCIACLLEGRYLWADVHHLLRGGKRIGHHATIPLCPWHHRGLPQVGSVAEATGFMGPSLALNKRAFVERYGDENFLLSLVDFAYETWQRQRFSGMPPGLRDELRRRWNEREQ